MHRETAADVRTRILDAALGLLGEHGVTELTQPKVARAAGVRQSHLTYYFPTRGDLLKGVAAHAMATLIGPLAEAASAGEFTPALMAARVGRALADKRRARVMLGLVVSAEEDHAIRVFVREFVARVREGITALARSLGAQPDAQTVAGVHALIVGAAILNVARDDAVSRQEAIDAARMAVERLFGKPLRQARAPVGRARRARRAGGTAG